MNAVVKTPQGEVRAHKDALRWMRGILSEHRHRYGSRGRQVLRGVGDYERYGLPDMDVCMSQFEGRSMVSGPGLSKDPLIGYRDV